jgi:hypothetical protein
MRRCVDEMDLSVCELELTARALERVNRRGGPLMRRGGRSGGNGESAPGGEVLPLYGIRDLSTANRYDTPSPGGEAGTASGFGIVEFLSIDKLGVARFLKNRANSSLSAGYGFYITAANVLSFVCGSGTPAAVYSPGYTVQPSDVGKILCLVGWFDASVPAALKVRLLVSRMQVGAGTAIVGYTALANKTTISSTAGTAGSNPATDTTFYASATFLGTPSEAQVLAYVDAARALGDMPATMDGATIAHRWSLRAALAGLTVVSGQVGPAEIADTVTSAAADALGRVGSPIVVARDTSIDGRKSYGAQGFSATSHFRAQTAGIRGSAAGLTVFLDFTLNALSPTGGRIYSSYNDAIGAGCSLHLDSGPTLSMYAFGGPSLLLRAFGVSDVGQRVTGAVTWDGTTWTPYFNGVAGTPVAGGFARNTSSPMWVGYGPDNTPASIISLHGLAGCDQALTAAEVAQVHATLRATGVLDLPAGKTNPHTYDLTRDIAPAPELGVPAQVLDRAGTDHLTRVGTGLTVAQRVERVYSYETTPVLNGASGFTPTARLERAGDGFGGDASGMFWQLLLRFDSQGVPARTRQLLGNYIGATDGGFLLYSYGSHSSIQPVFVHAGGSVTGLTTTAISASDVGRLMLLTAVIDNGATKAKLYLRRAMVGLGTDIAGYRPRVGGTLLIGEANSGGASDGITIFGAQFGISPPSAAEIWANHDATMAENDIVAIPGRTTNLYSIKRSVAENGGVMPATIADRVGSAHLTRTGSLTVSPQHAHAYAW